MFCLLAFLFLTPFSLHAAGEKVQTIVIDPGHGGKDAGAVGKHCYEKNIALAVSLALGRLINENFPDVKVIYTREDDRFVELRQRSRIANQNHADLFISIHCNSSKSKDANGVETWIMGNHKNDDNLKVAQLENSAILQEKDHEEHYDNFDPNSPDAYIIFSLYQNVFMDQSLGFASKIQDQYGQRVPSVDRGIKQAGFIVLWSCALPSVLTEIGFISNAAEEKFLNSEDGQQKIALSLFNAFKEYKYQMEGFNNQAEFAKTSASGGKSKKDKDKDVAAKTEAKPADTVVRETVASTATQAIKSKTDTLLMASKTDVKTDAKVEPKAEVKPEPKTAPKAEQKTDVRPEAKQVAAKPETKPEPKPTNVLSAAVALNDTAVKLPTSNATAVVPVAATKEPTVVESSAPDTLHIAAPPQTKPTEVPVIATQPTATTQVADTTKAEPQPVAPTQQTATAQPQQAPQQPQQDTTPSLVFKIQFACSSTNKDLDAPEFKNLNLPVLSKYEENGLFKYCCGEAATPAEALKILRRVQEAGFRDAFMVVFSDGQKISTKEAYRILQERNK